MPSDDEKYDEDDVTREDLERIARRSAPSLDTIFIGDRSHEYYLGFLRALQLARQLARMKPIEQEREHQDIVSMTARAALGRLRRLEPIDWNEAKVPKGTRERLEPIWNEVRRCVDTQCATATIAMSGKLLEEVCWGLLRLHDPEEFEKALATEPKLGLNAVWNRVRKRFPDLKFLDLKFQTIADSRNASVHMREDFEPDMTEAEDIAAEVRRVIITAWRLRPARARRRTDTVRT